MVWRKALLTNLVFWPSCVMSLYASAYLADLVEWAWCLSDLDTPETMRCELDHDTKTWVLVLFGLINVGVVAAVVEWAVTRSERSGG